MNNTKTSEIKGTAQGREKVIFLGNGPLAESTLAVLTRECEVLFTAHRKEDLARVVKLKREFPEAHGVLASFGVLIPSEVLAEFEPEGILNIHPSLLPKYRGASPIESAILAGDNDFSVSVMKLAEAMDAGPVYHQATLTGLLSGAEPGRARDKAEIYHLLATTGAEWLVAHLQGLPEPAEQMGEPTFTTKLTKKMGLLTPDTDTAELTWRKILAFAGFPKAKYAFFGVPCTVLEARVLEVGGTAPLVLPCADGALVAVDRLQPEGRKAMDAKSFLNGYGKNR